MKAHVVLGSIATLGLFGCDSPATTGNSSTAAPVAETAQGVTLEVVPATMRECDPPGEVRLTWDATGAGVTGVKIFTMGDDGEMRLFAFLGPQGTEKTGAWTTANDVIVLKDESEQQQLAKFVIGAEKCE